MIREKGKQQKINIVIQNFLSKIPKEQIERFKNPCYECNEDCKSCMYSYDDDNQCVMFDYRVQVINHYPIEKHDFMVVAKEILKKIDI